MDSQGTGRSQPGQAHAPAPPVVDDRRIHPRHDDQVRVRFRDLEGIQPGCWGVTRNISLGGLLLHAQAPIAVGSHLALELHIEGVTSPILALGGVLRLEEQHGGYAAGVRFLWVHDEDRRNLHRLADYFRRRYGA